MSLKEIALSKIKEKYSTLIISVKSEFFLPKKEDKQKA